MTSPVKQALEKFFATYLAAAREQGQSFPELEFDPEWLSACQNSPVDGNSKAAWQPTEQQPPVDFSGLENALEIAIHPDIKAYYGSFWSGCLDATAEEGHVSLIQLWNPDDFDRLIENLIGHALAKKRLKQPMTIFFATTEVDSEFFLSIDNESGEVLLECHLDGLTAPYADRCVCHS